MEKPPQGQPPKSNQLVAQTRDIGKAVNSGDRAKFLEAVQGLRDAMSRAKQLSSQPATQTRPTSGNTEDTAHRAVYLDKPPPGQTQQHTPERGRGR